MLVKGKTSVFLFLAVAGGIGLWFEVALAARWADSFGYDFHPEHVLVSVALFVSVYALSHWMDTRATPKEKDYGVVLSAWSMRFMLIGLLIFSFEEPWIEMLNANYRHTTDAWVLVAAFVIVSLALAFAAGKLRTFVALNTVCLIAMLTVVYSGEGVHSLLFQVATNVTVVVAGIVLVLKGVTKGASHYFFGGVLTILATGLLRYIDLIGDYVGGAIVFAIMAVVLIVAARFWKHRQVEA